jgi:hypothetical protein
VGILRVAKAGWLSGVNNLKVNWRLSFLMIATYLPLQVFTMDVDRYSKACMFTEDETRKLFDREAAFRGYIDVLFFSG